MMSVEKLITANVKNRIEATHLCNELGRIDKEKRNELRMLNNEKQRFRARYSKSSFNTEPATNEAQASDVRMYETHNPGFCFRRNGEHRVQQAPVVGPPVDFEHLHFLLFTDGEVDIEKVLCLHLLSAHETEHLTPPKRMKNINVFLKKDTPLEQLIERSETRHEDVITSMILPAYVLDVSKTESKLLQDDRLKGRLLINEKILELISTVITTLKISNPEKVQQLMGIAEDPSCLKRIFRKSHIQDFVFSLKDHTLVSSCSSFILTQPLKTKASRIEIRTPSGSLEDLIKFIRASVLQLPNRDTWRKLQEQRINQIKKLEDEKSVRSSSNMSKRELEFSKVPSYVNAEEVKVEMGRNVDESESVKFRRVVTNFIARNIARAANFRRVPSDTDQENLPPKRGSKEYKKRRGSADSRKSFDRRIVEKNENVGGNDVTLKLSPISNKSHTSEDVKVHIKQTTCSACMERWKLPLPSPKVSHVTKSFESATVTTGGTRANKMQRLSTLIEREQYKLNSYDRKYSNSSNVACSLYVYKKASNEMRPSLDYIMLDVYDLEKIKQEIREKEAKKKLEKFLSG